MKKILLLIIMATISCYCFAKVTADSILQAVANEQMRPPLKYRDDISYKLNENFQELHISSTIKINQKHDTLFLLEVFPLEGGFHMSMWNKQNFVICDSDGYLFDNEFEQSIRKEISLWDKEKILRYNDLVKNHMHDGVYYLASKITVENGKIVDIDTIEFRDLTKLIGI